ncbi:MAG: lipopolysaccharide biosynthesis protein [Pseudohongiellaceae bacterium]
MDTNNTSDNHGQVGSAIARGAVWTVSLRMTVRFISVISTLILARLLTPEDFGIYALAMTVYAFVDLLGAFGFGSALIQNQDATDAHYNTAWTLHFIFSLMTSSLLFVLAPYAAEFLREPQLETVVRFMCIIFLLDGIKNVGIINFQKHMTFDREFRFSLMTKLTGFLITIPLAILLRSYWAMLWGLLSSSLMLLVLSYVMQPFRPRPELSRWREMISFTAWLQVNNILNYFNRHTGKVLVSRMADVASVGSLQLAREIGLLLREVVQPVNRAVFPGYARVNKDPARMLDVFCDVNGMLMMIGFPIAIGLFTIAHLFVPTVLGEQWLHVVPLIKWLALASLMTVGMSSTNNVLIALARMKWAVVIIAVNLALMVGFMLYLLPLYGVLGVAYAMVISLLFVLVLCYLALKIHIRLGLHQVVSMMYRPALSALVMFILVQALFPSHSAASGLLIQILELAGAIVSGATGYCLVLVSLWLLAARPEGPELKLLRIVHNRSGFGGFLLPVRTQHA